MSEEQQIVVLKMTGGRFRRWLVNKLGGFTEQNKYVYQSQVADNLEKFTFTFRTSMFSPYIGSSIEKECIKDEIARSFGRKFLDSEIARILYTDDIPKCERVYRIDFYAAKIPEWDILQNNQKGNEENVNPQDL